MGSRGGGGQDNAAGPARGAVTNPPWHRRALICETNWPPLEKKRADSSSHSDGDELPRACMEGQGWLLELGIPQVLLPGTCKRQFLFPPPPK